MDESDNITMDQIFFAQYESLRYTIKSRYVEYEITGTIPIWVGGMNTELLAKPIVRSLTGKSWKHSGVMGSRFIMDL